MKLKSFIASVVLLIALVLFFRYSTGPYIGLYILKVNEASAWVSGVAMLITIKSVQLSPLACRLTWLVGIRYEWCMALSCLAFPVDFLIMLKGHQPGDIGGLVQLVGSIGWAGLVRLLVLQWLDHSSVIPRFSKKWRTSPSNQNPVAHPQSLALSAFNPNNQRLVAHPGSETDQSRSAVYAPSPQWDFIANTTGKIGNRFIFGLPGCGKGMTMAHWLRTIKTKFDVTIVYIDPKAKPEERGYFEGIVDVYHAARISRMEAGEAIKFIKAGLSVYEQICDSKQSRFTLLVLDEGTSIGKLFNSERNNYLDRRLTDYVSGGDGDGCNIWFVSQSPFMDDLGVKSGVATQLLKLVIAREEDLESLKSWGNSVLMRGIDVDKARSAIKNSPVGRGVFYGGKAAGWYPMPMLENFSTVDRDARSGEKPTAAHNVEVSVTAAAVTAVTAAAVTAVTAAESLDLPVLDYFAAADPGRPKTVKHLRDSSRLRDRATSKELEDALDRLTSRGDLIRLPDGWVLPDWQDSN